MILFRSVTRYNNACCPGTPLARLTIGYILKKYLQSTAFMCPVSSSCCLLLPSWLLLVPANKIFCHKNGDVLFFHNEINSLICIQNPEVFGFLKPRFSYVEFSDWNLYSLFLFYNVVSKIHLLKVSNLQKIWTYSSKTSFTWAILESRTHMRSCHPQVH